MLVFRVDHVQASTINASIAAVPVMDGSCFTRTHTHTHTQVNAAFTSLEWSPGIKALAFEATAKSFQSFVIANTFYACSE